MFDSDRRTLGRYTGSAMVAETGQPGEDAGGRGDAPATVSLPSSTVGSVVLPDSRSDAAVSWGLGSKLLMVALLKLREPECQPFI